MTTDARNGLLTTDFPCAHPGSPRQCPAWCDGSWHERGDFSFHSSAMTADGGDQASWVMWLNQGEEGHRQTFVTLHLSASDPGAREDAVGMLFSACARTLGMQLIELADKAEPGVTS